MANILWEYRMSDCTFLGGTNDITNGPYRTDESNFDFSNSNVTLSSNQFTDWFSVDDTGCYQIRFKSCTSEDCGVADDQEVEYGDAFKVGSFTSQYPENADQIKQNCCNTYFVFN